MATEQSASYATGNETFAKWASWLAGLAGLWVLVSPFVLTGEIASSTPMWSNVVSGALIALFSAYGAYALRSTLSGVSASYEWGAWLAAIIGLWVLVTPFILTGMITSGTVMWSNVVAGIIVLVVDAVAGYGIHTA